MKYKILHVATSLETGGAEKLLLDSLPKYVNKDIDVDLLLLNGTEYPFYKELKEKNINIFSLGKGSVYNPFLIFKMIPYFKKYDLIHVHLFPTLYWVALAKMVSLSDTSIIFTEHSTSNRRIGSVLGEFFDRIIYRNYSRIISISDDVSKLIKNHLNATNTSKYIVINNGIDLSKFEVSNFPIDIDIKKQISIIQVSSFNDAKDQQTVIKSLQYLSDKFHLTLVGDGKNKESCKKLVQELGLAQRVHFSGIRTDVPDLLKKSELAVLSSHYEGFGLSAVEAMASGIPLIASDVAGLNEIVRGAGILFPVGDAKSLAMKINSLVLDRDFYIQTRDACLIRSKEYDIDIMVDKYIELYKSLIEK